MIKNKKETGNVLIIVLVFVTLFSTIAYIAYEIANKETIVSEKIKLKGKTNVAASSAVNIIISRSQTDDGDINKYILNADTDGILYCITNNGIIKNEGTVDGCSGYFDDIQKTISLSLVKKSNTNCEIYGYSNLKVDCYSVTGYGSYTPIDIKSGEYQKIQVRTVNTESGGVYEL